MVSQNHPNTMKDKEIEKVKEKILKLMGLPMSTRLLKGGHDQAPWEITNPAGSTLIPRVSYTTIMVYAFSTDIRMVPSRHHTNNIEHGIRDNGMNDLDLHMAASRGDMVRAQDVVGRNRKLLCYGDSLGNLPLHLAMERGHKEMVYYLVTEYPQASYALNGLNESPLYLAVEQNSMDSVEFMFKKLDGDKNVVDGLRRVKSVVHAAITQQNREMLATILKFQRDLIKFTNEDGLTPLSYAAFNGFVDIVSYIIKKCRNAVSNYKNADGSFPIHKACLGGHLEVLKLFHSNSPISLLSKDTRGRTILHVAAIERGNRLNHVVSYLFNLDEGRELIREEDENGCTALDLAHKSRNRLVEEAIQRMMP